MQTTNIPKKLISLILHNTINSERVRLSASCMGGKTESRACGGVLGSGVEAGRFEEGDRKEQHIPTALLAIVPTLTATQCFFHSSIGSHYQPPDNENTGCLLQ